MNLIFNFSSIPLTPAMESVLNKGLNFCPNPSNVNITQLLADLFRLERKMAWKSYFGDAEVNANSNDENEKFPFPEIHKKTNLPKEYPSEIKTFVNSVKSELIGSEHNKIKPNITKEELEALEELIKLKKDGKIVIQPGDKNCGICILDRKDYIKKYFCF